MGAYGTRSENVRPLPEPTQAKISNQFVIGSFFVSRFADVV
jgi:hypothetical protein